MGAPATSTPPPVAMANRPGGIPVFQAANAPQPQATGHKGQNAQEVCSDGFPLHLVMTHSGDAGKEA